jgi:hypothetical protein
VKDLTACRWKRNRWAKQQRWRGAISLMLLFLILSCARPPQESVELSVTVGRDIAQAHQSHRQLAVILYSRIKKDVNRFVDDVYAPYQIHNLLKADQEDFMAGNLDTLFAALDAAIKRPDKPDVQKTALDAMNVFLQVVRADIESYRRERLAPVLSQEQKVLSTIDRSYNQIHYANSIVTGHLASMMRVYDTQEEVLKEFGLGGLHEEISQRLARTSNSVAEFVEQARKGNVGIENMEQKMGDLTAKLDSFVSGPQEK